MASVMTKTHVLYNVLIKVIRKNDTYIDIQIYTYIHPHTYKHTYMYIYIERNFISYKST